MGQWFSSEVPGFCGERHLAVTLLASEKIKGNNKVTD